ncbi:rhodanese-like domain-containing protein [Galactobacter valiniphilus]|uniref:rhodanese-like domain-containing protein n=1 Tax=Galactobacter valiniphilus TaxID=2676122 RepID=UPI0037366060
MSLAPLLIDVRSAAEFEAVHAPGSVNVPLPVLLEHRAEAASKLRGPVTLLCASGARAEEARAALAGEGFTDATVLTGGVNALEKEGGAVRTSGTWALERQVRLVAGSLVLAGLAGGRFLSPKLRGLSGIIGGGLTFAALSNTCAMGSLLSRAPWNRAAHEPTAEEALAALERV